MLSCHCSCRQCLCHTMVHQFVSLLSTWQYDLFIPYVGLPKARSFMLTLCCCHAIFRLKSQALFRYYHCTTFSTTTPFLHLCKWIFHHGYHLKNPCHNTQTTHTQTLHLPEFLHLHKSQSYWGEGEGLTIIFSNDRGQKCRRGGDCSKQEDETAEEGGIRGRGLGKWWKGLGKTTQMGKWLGREEVKKEG